MLHTRHNKIAVSYSVCIQSSSAKTCRTKAPRGKRLQNKKVLTIFGGVVRGRRSLGRSLTVGHVRHGGDGRTRRGYGRRVAAAA